MSRIWNCLTRGLLARPPISSSQTTSQITDDNESCTQVPTFEKELKKFLERSTLLPGDQLFAWWARNEEYQKQRKKSFRDGTEICYTKWDNFAYGAASILLVGHIGRFMSKLFYARVAEKKRRAIRSPEQWKQTDGVSSLPITSTVRSVLSKVPAIALSCSTAHAASDTNEEGTQIINVIKSCRQIDENQASTQKFSNSITYNSQNSVVFSCGLNDEKAKEKCDTLLSGEELDKFLSSTQECIGMTYNIQGINSYKAGNFHDAYQYFQLGSEGGSSKAQYNLAICYHNGRGTKKDLNKARKEYGRAARQGHKIAQYNLAVLLLEENDVVKTNMALRYLEKSAEQGLMEAQSLVGSYYAREGVHHNMKKAVRMFQLAADQEDRLSTYHLAECHEHGLGGLDVDNSKAFDLYASASSLGHHEAHFKMAMMLLNGCPEIEKNEELAMEILKKAGDLGHKKSAAKLAHLKRVAVSKNIAEKSQKFRFNLGHFIQPGSVLPRNPIRFSQLTFAPEVMRSLSPAMISAGTPSVFPSTSYDYLSAGPSKTEFGHCMHRVSSCPSHLLRHNDVVN